MLKIEKMDPGSGMGSQILPVTLSTSTMGAITFLLLLGNGFGFWVQI